MLTPEELQRARDYATVFGGDGAGRRVLDDLRRACFAFRSTFTPGDPYETARNEGAREVVLRIQRLMELEKDGLLESTTTASSYFDGAQPEEE